MNLPSRMNKAQKELYESWTKEGFDIDDEMIKELRALGGKNNTGASVEREAELVLLSLHLANVPQTKACKKCTRKFQTNYVYNAYCSDDCRAGALAEIGINWDSERSETDRWEFYEPPSIISPELYEKLLAWAKEIVRQADEVAPMQEQIKITKAKMEALSYPVCFITDEELNLDISPLVIERNYFSSKYASPEDIEIAKHARANLPSEPVADPAPQPSAHKKSSPVDLSSLSSLFDD